MICKSNKKHISYFIRQTYNNQDKDNRDINELKNIIKELKILMLHAINNKLKKRGNSDGMLDQIFERLGKIVSCFCLSLRTIAYPYNINIYHHEKSNKKFARISEYIWKILLLDKLQYNPQVTKQIISLKKIYDTKFLNKPERDTYLFIHGLLYFLYDYKKTNVVKYDEHVYDNIIRMHYDDTNQSIETGEVRENYLEIDSKKISKSIKKNKERKETIEKNIKIKPKNTFIKAPLDKIISNDRKIKRKRRSIDNIGENKNQIVMYNTQEEEKVEMESEKEPTPESFSDVYNLKNVMKDSIVIKKKTENDKGLSGTEQCMIDFYFNFDMLPEYNKRQKVLEDTSHKGKKSIEYEKRNYERENDNILISKK
jgi:hypothetical protein